MSLSSRSSRVAFALSALALVALVAGGSAEGMVRIAARRGSPLEAKLRPYDPFAILIEPCGATGYRPKAGAVFRYPTGAAAHVDSGGFRGPDPQRMKPDGALRVVLLGGSTTFGWGVDDDATIDAHLRTILGAQQGRPPVEVINAAFDGYDSYALLERLRNDVIQLKPDLLIVNEGINDVRGARYQHLVEADPRTTYYVGPLRRMREEQERGGPYMWSRVKHASYLVRLAILARDVLLNRDRGRAPAGKARYPVYMDAADNFERNMRTIGQVAAANGMAVLFSTPPSSLRDNFAPTAQSGTIYWLNDAEETAAYRDSLAGRLQKVATDLARSGDRVAYVRPVVPHGEFLDDAHLTGRGNQVVAEAFSRAILDHQLLAREH